MAKYDGRSFRVVHVVDGDTLDLDIPDAPHHHHTRIRLLGIDTPDTSSHRRSLLAAVWAGGMGVATLAKVAGLAIT